jgi:hypothetical protein
MSQLTKTGRHREMATKQAVNKTQAVHDYLNAHPGAGIREIVAALDKQGIKITLGYVATIKVRIYGPEAPPTVEKPPAGTLTRDQLKLVAQVIKRIRSREIASEIANP